MHCPTQTTNLAGLFSHLGALHSSLQHRHLRRLDARTRQRNLCVLLALRVVHACLVGCKRCRCVAVCCLLQRLLQGCLLFLRDGMVGTKQVLLPSCTCSCCTRAAAASTRRNLSALALSCCRMSCARASRSCMCHEFIEYCECTPTYQVIWVVGGRAAARGHAHGLCIPFLTTQPCGAKSPSMQDGAVHVAGPRVDLETQRCVRCANKILFVCFVGGQTYRSEYNHTAIATVH